MNATIAHQILRWHQTRQPCLRTVRGTVLDTVLPSKDRAEGEMDGRVMNKGQRRRVAAVEMVMRGLAAD
jgi:hypothetical protein